MISRSIIFFPIIFCPYFFIVFFFASFNCFLVLCYFTLNYIIQYWVDLDLSFVVNSILEFHIF